MDNFVKAEIVNVAALEASHNGPTAELTTRRGDVYHVWIDHDGAPLIELVVRG